MNDVEIRPARHAELHRVAELRWEWTIENGGSADGDRAEGYPRLDRQPGHCRAPGRRARARAPRSPERRSGDVQCEYVVPGERDSGIGGCLIEAEFVLARARTSAAPPLLHVSPAS
ncbi:MAG TPA: hypothetical protein VHC18_17915 [Amycolatopsis sp.]|nr:hypothetical protein [Amycolatopsis sp.]